MMEIIYLVLFFMLLYDFDLFRKQNTTKKEEKPIIKKRTVNEITTEMLRNELYVDNLLNRWSNKWPGYYIETCPEIIKIEAEIKKERDEFYFQKHFKINVRLSIKQTKSPHGTV